MNSCSYQKTSLSPLSAIHEELWDNKGYQLVIHTSFPAKAFFALARLRHAQVEVGYHTIERQVWRYCHTLIIVKLPSTVVTIANAVFQGCYALTTVAMPGCLSLGARIFAECCALERVPSDFTWIGPAACERCLQLLQVDLSQTEITEIMNCAFAHCQRLQRLKLPNKLRKIQ